MFSDHYLKARLSITTGGPGDTEAQPIWEFCKELYEKRAFALRRYDNEMGVRQELIDKILEKLGFAWSDNLHLPETEQEFEPDYILYANAEAKEAVLDKDVATATGPASAFSRPRSLATPFRRSANTNSATPTSRSAIISTRRKCSWGILTNGKEWRLYCRDTRPSHFFAINIEVAVQLARRLQVLPRAVQSRRLHARRPGQMPARPGPRERALRADGIGSDLRQRVFTIVEILANGFAERPENKITDADLPASTKTA